MTFTAPLIKNDANPLTPDEFRDALAKGMGRAVRHVRLSPSGAVRELLLDGCIHCKPTIHVRHLDRHYPNEAILDIDGIRGIQTSSRTRKKPLTVDEHDT